MPAYLPLLALGLASAPNPSVQAANHPLMNADPRVLLAAYNRGRATAMKNRKLTSAQFLRKWSQDIGKAPKKQKGWTAPYVMVFVPMATCENWGFNDAKDAVSDEKFRSLLPGLTAPGGAFTRRFTLTFMLYAYPGFNAFGDVRRKAKSADVMDVKFWVGYPKEKWEGVASAGALVSSDAGGYERKSDRTEYDTVYTSVGPATVATNVRTTTTYPTFSARWRCSYLAVDPKTGIGFDPSVRELKVKIIRQDRIEDAMINLDRFLKNVPRV